MYLQFSHYRELNHSIYRASFHKTYIYTHIIQISDGHCFHGTSHDFRNAIDVIHLHILRHVFGFSSKQEGFF